MKHLEYFNVLRFLIGKKVSKASRDEVCADLGISQSTYYRLLEKIRKLPVASSLQPKKRGPKKGQPRLSDIQEELTRNFILREHLTKQKPRASKSYLRLIEEFDRLSVEVPSDRTFRRRLKSITKECTHQREDLNIHQKPNIFRLRRQWKWSKLITLSSTRSQ